MTVEKVGQTMTEKKKFGRFAFLLNRSWGTCLLSLGLLSVLGFFGQLGPWADIFSNFRAAYVLAFGFLLIVFTCSKSWRLAGVSLLLFLMNVSTFVPLYSAPSAAAHAGVPGPVTRILELNIFGGKNLQREKTIKLIHESRADIVGISEVTAPWMVALQTNLKQYPYQIYEPRFGGVALLSKYPLKETEVRYFGGIQRPRIITTAQINGKSVRVLFAHPVIPLYPKGSRDGEFLVLAEELKAENKSAILFGDLNVTPWSYNFNKLLTDSGLKDTNPGFGFQPTWCSFVAPLTMLFAIDHCLVTDDFVVADRRVLQNIGSDHIPLQVDLKFKWTVLSFCSQAKRA